jgi:hypothetical protein
MSLITYQEITPSGMVHTVKVSAAWVRDGYAKLPDMPDIAELRAECAKVRAKHGESATADRKLKRAVHDRLRLEVAR